MPTNIFVWGGFPFASPRVEATRTLVILMSNPLLQKGTSYNLFLTVPLSIFEGKAPGTLRKRHERTAPRSKSNPSEAVSRVGPHQSEIQSQHLY